MNAGQIQQDIQAVAEMLRSARYAVVLTGAGISTPSGIPDFRSAGSGQWAKNDPMQVASLTAFRRRPEVFFNWLRPLAESMSRARPNPAHVALAEMQQADQIQAIITQNIDNLHQSAGAKHVLELHGSMNTLSCLSCGHQYPTEDFLAAFVQDGQFPRCTSCQSLLKPDIVLYEEMLPVDVWEESVHECQQADLMIVAGSSLEVYPANSLPPIAMEQGAKLVILNLGPTSMDIFADLCIREDLAVSLPEIRRLL